MLYVAYFFGALIVLAALAVALLLWVSNEPPVDFKPDYLEKTKRKAQ